MDHLKQNRDAWNKRAVDGHTWSTPVDADTIARTRSGMWHVVLTPKAPVPREWFGDLASRDVLCLASAGGQQAPILSAAGANVVSFDLSEEQLARDQFVAERDGLRISTVRGDMADLSMFDDESFDLIFHPVSNVFVPDVRPVWRECHRVLRKGGVLLAGFMNPSLFMFDHEVADATGELLVKFSLPYSDIDALAPAVLEQQLARGEPVSFSHSLDAQIGGQIEAGFALAGFYEDRWINESWQFSKYSPVAMATLARK